ncbi:hypothetical protein [Thermoflexus hugenholtzii]|uniref:Uncharacterized protein n=1 Tax=Thermoflexus hugenholtzii JAD2 TaxID=877466 RepID=A0A212QRQ1_9CHLR|nr:hypothetical protein [Thermoflexus hugenholtzii]SNB62260.1 hypothetical protein SAMN02746019_00004760 [Thermoflexus hugenholtzii JAD2]
MRSRLDPRPRAFLRLLLLLLGVGAVGRISAIAWAQGNAQVISPPRDQPVRGTVDIVGIATHPNFAKYDVAILDAYDFTKEWRWLVEGRAVRAEVPMVLATWNTTLFPDGDYVILIRIWDQGGGHQDFLFPGYRVANAMPTPTPTEEIAPTFEPEPTGTPVLTPTVQIELPPTPTPGPTLTPIPGIGRTTGRDSLGPEALIGAFLRGVQWTFLLFGAWGGIRLLRWAWRRLARRPRAP